jgi:hypothetical protein
MWLVADCWLVMALQQLAMLGSLATGSTGNWHLVLLAC